MMLVCSTTVFGQTTPAEPQESHALAAIGQKFGEQLTANFNQMVLAYNNLPDSDHGRILNSDLALELSPDYLKNQAISEYIRTPARAFIARLYALKLSRSHPVDSNVLFTAGGTGVGKTTALKMFTYLEQKAEIVYDSTLSDFEFSKALIDQSLNTGRSVTVIYVYRDIVDAFENGVIPRAVRIGRLVTIDAHIAMNLNARKVMDQLTIHYANNPKFQLIALDNSRGLNQQRFVALSTIPEESPEYLSGKLKEALSNSLQSGKITQQMHDNMLISH